MKAFRESLTTLPDSLPDTYRANFTEEIMKNVFGESRRTELTISEDDLNLRRSERGLSNMDNHNNTHCGTSSDL